MISDLHIGASSGADLLRRPELREPLAEAVRDVDRLVVLGDGLELRDGPHRDALAVAGPFFEDMGRALGPDGELLVTAGNHDHGLVAGWIDGRLMIEPSGFLGLEQRIEPREAGVLAARARRACRARARAGRLPGRLAARRRLRDPRPLLRPARHDPDVRAAGRRRDGALGGVAARRAGDAGRLRGRAVAALRVDARAHPAVRARDGQRGRAARRRAPGWRSAAAVAGCGRAPSRCGAGFAVAVAAINRLGIGPVERDLSGAGLRRGYLRGLRRDAAAARRAGAARDLRPLAPLRPVAGRRPRGVDDARRRAAAQHAARGSTSRTS